MNHQSKLLGAALLTVATTANAMPRALVFTASDIVNYEALTGVAGVQQRLLSMGILVPTNKAGIYVLDDSTLANITDEQTILLVSDLASWLTGGKTQQCNKAPCMMTNSSQDYAAK